MGLLRYGASGVEIAFDDRTLVHIRAAVIAKLRRGESFTLSFTRHVRSGSGRRTLWFHPAVPLRFDIGSVQAAGSINRVWVQQLVETSNGGEMMIVDEPGITPDHSREEPPPPPVSAPSRYS